MDVTRIARRDDTIYLTGAIGRADRHDVPASVSDAEVECWLCQENPSGKEKLGMDAMRFASRRRALPVVIMPVCR